jgi:hypothetical protein
MADAIRFREFLVCDTDTQKTIEECAKALFSYAGIHDRNFDDDLDDDFATLSSTTWDTGGATGTWSIASSQLQGVGGGAAAWYYLLSNDDMPSEGVLTVYKNSTRGGVVFRATDNNNHYLFFWDSNSVGFQKKSSGNYSILIDLPKTYTGAGNVTLSWREMKFRPEADHKWLIMSAWMDGELCCTTEDDITGKTVGHKAGFAAYQSDTVLFDDVNIPELTEVIGAATLDVNESPASGLGRAVGRRFIRYFLRYDGALRMWRPKSATSSYTYDNHITGFNWDVDYRQQVSHWRQVGAWEQVDRFDTTLLQRGIQRFRRDDNPELKNREMCYNEAGYAIQHLKEKADCIDMDVPAQVLQEPEDVVTVYFARDGSVVINNVDYIVDIEQSQALSFQGDKLASTLHLRKSEG